MSELQVDVRQWGPDCFGTYVHDEWSHPWGDFVGIETSRPLAQAFGKSALATRRNRCRARNPVGAERASSAVVWEDRTVRRGTPPDTSHNLRDQGAVNG